MTQLLTDNEISTVVHDIDCGEVRPFDIEFARAIESAVLAKLREQNEPVALPFAILDEEMKDLHRFHECVTDGEGYDVPKEKMKCLAEIGLVRRVTANVYEHTTFGLSVINGDFTHPAPIPEGLLDLLAIIHRDGGHYTDEHGIDKAINDAKDKVWAMLAAARSGE